MKLAKTEEERVKYCDKLLELSEKPNITKIRFHFLLEANGNSEYEGISGFKILFEEKGNGFKIFQLEKSYTKFEMNIFMLMKLCFNEIQELIRFCRSITNGFIYQSAR